MTAVCENKWDYVIRFSLNLCVDKKISVLYFVSGLTIRYESCHGIEKARGGGMATNQAIFFYLGI